MDESNQRDGIEFYRYFSIGTQDTTYDYNDEFWDSIYTSSIIPYFILIYKLIVLHFNWN